MSESIEKIPSHSILPLVFCSFQVNISMTELGVPSRPSPYSTLRQSPDSCDTAP